MLEIYYIYIAFTLACIILQNGIEKMRLSACTDTSEFKFGCAEVLLGWSGVGKIK